MKTSEFQHEFDNRLNIHVAWLTTIEKDVEKIKKELAISQNHVQEISEFEIFLLKIIIHLNDKTEYFKTLLEYISGKSIHQLENEYRTKKESRRKQWQNNSK